MRALIVLVAILGLARPALAECVGPEGLPEPGPVSEPQPFHFHRAGLLSLACVVPRDDGAAMAERAKPTTILPCLRIGAVAVGDSVAEVEARLGETDRVSVLDVRTQARGYFIAQRSAPQPYYVVTYQDSRVVAVQLKGPPTELPARFSGLNLGDSAQAVIDRLGWPAKRCRLAASGGETWLWRDFPIGIDMAEGVAVGFKVTWPGSR